jgi:hypothetical protein
MGTYDTIGLAVGGQPISSSQFGSKVRASILDIDARLLALEAQASLPMAVRGGASGQNVITSGAGVWANMATSTWGSISITNPSPDFDLYCLVTYGAWMVCPALASQDLRFGVLMSGGLVGGPDPGSPGPAGNGMIPIEAAATLSSQHMGSFSIVIPAGAGAVSFVAQGKRNVASGTQNINYPSIEVVPIRFQ